MTFSKELRRENEDVFRAIFQHPFIKGLADETISKEALIHYVKADYEYLNAFIQVYGMTVTKSKTRDEMAFFNQQIDFVLNGEIHPHHNLSHVAGVTYDSLKGFPLPPTADHYIKHMVYHAYTADLPEIICAMIPCPWTYLEIGEYLMETVKPSKEHKFYPWISFYADSEIHVLTRKLCEIIDKYGESASTEAKRKMKGAFRKSCQLELSFWEMAYTCEGWPVRDEVLTDAK